MWSDTLLAAERLHLLRILMWGALGVSAGALLAVSLAVRRVRAPLLRAFALQGALWGGVELLFAALAWRTLGDREYVAAVQLASRVWMEVVLDVAFILTGSILTARGWTRGRPGVVGSGIAVVVQGVALLTIDAPFLLLLRGVL
ncbi:MAG: hypothetical protein M3Z10_08145 [Gemmatimonadota bacterium]|nr:hypothetical protein [Gemmatimonadota bacterium]